MKHPAYCQSGQRHSDSESASDACGSLPLVAAESREPPCIFYVIYVPFFTNV